jgi:hypothetical protein
LSRQHRKDPVKQASPDFAPVDLVEHFVPSTGVEIVGDIRDVCFVIKLNQNPDSFELLAHGIFAAGKKVDRQVAAYLAKIGRIG